MGRGTALLALIAALAAPAAARADGLPPVEAASAGTAPLYVEVMVNGRSSGDIVPLRLVGDGLIVETAALRQAGLLLGGEGTRDVARLPGVRARYDAALQRLDIAASPDLMLVSHIAADERPRMPTIADWGAMLNYDAYVQRSGNRTAAALWTEQRLFGPAGTFSNDGTLRIGAGRSGYLRYDTRMRHVDEARALAVTAGDIVTQSLPWSTSVRLGGVQIARDYRVRPDLLTMPLPSFAGQAAVPSAVDLFVDGYRQQRADVAPGRFVLDSVPVVNGAGQATIVTTDAVGRQIATVIPFYVSATLLRPGLLDIAGEIGFVRRNYALKSFDYGTLAASATARRGMTGHLTLEAHGEASDRLRLAGAGIVWAPWHFGTVSASAAASRADARTGSAWSVGYNYASRRFGIAWQHDERGRAYRDLGSVDFGALAGTRSSDRFVASLNIPRQGSLALAYVGGRTLDGPRTRIATASYSRPLGGYASLFVSADREFSTGRTSAQLRVVLPFGRSSIGGGISRTGGRGLAQVDYARATPIGGGLGVDAGIASDDRGRAYGQGTATWRMRTMQLQAGAAVAGGRESLWGSATGAIVTMQGGLFATNQVSDSFALVSTGDAAGVDVLYENQSVGTTDRHGRLFVPNVASYVPVRFAIDTLSLSAETVAASVERRLAFRQGTGAYVAMTVRHVRSVMVRLVGPDGAPLAPGGRIARASGDATIGWDGLAYLEDVPDRATLAVTRRDGAACTATLAVPAGTKPLARIGPLTCS